MLASCLVSREDAMTGRIIIRTLMCLTVIRKRIPVFDLFGSSLVVRFVMFVTRTLGVEQSLML
jgi:hypothetical protein